MIKDAIKEALNELFVDMWHTLINLLVDITFNLALIGGVIGIMLHVVGWPKGGRLTGILILVHVITRTLVS